LKLNKKTGTVRLSVLERNLSINELWRKIAEEGFNVSRATAARAKNSGVFIPGFRQLVAGRRLWTYISGWVYLTSFERSQSLSWLAGNFGISPSTARQARRRGWFEVNVCNYNKVDVPPGRLSQKPPGGE
jgi:hypothetical protein